MKSTAPPTIRSTSGARPADRRADRRRRSRQAMGRFRSAPTSAGRCGFLRTDCGVYAHKPTFALVPSRGHTPPPLPPLPFDRDLAVVGPMARSASDLTLLLDVMAGPDPLEAGVAYGLALPPPRHDNLRAFRVLLLDAHPLLPTATSVRGAIETLAGGLAKAGVQVARESSLLPDLVASSRLYMRMLLSFLAATFAPEAYAGAKAAAAGLDPGDLSLAAERLRGITLSHRDWVLADGGRARLWAEWRQVFRSFDAVICPVMPTPAYPHDHSADQEARRISIDGKDYPYVDQLIWPEFRHASRPARNSHSHRPVAGRPADRRADHRAVAGRSYAAEAG